MESDAFHTADAGAHSDAGTLTPDAAGLRALAESLMGERVIYFPVRHHSPACAWRLRELILARRPRIILVEAPSSFNSLLPLIVDDRTCAPFAAYTYCVENPPPDASCAACGLNPTERRHAAYYPFCDYSPELVALREGARIGAELRFIDLDYEAQCLAKRVEDESAPQSLLGERHLRRSRFLQLLAERNGCRDHDELWDHLFEARWLSMETAEFIARIVAYCQLARCEFPAEELEADGCAAREREMAWQIRSVLEAGAGRDGPMLAVTGGFHAVALPQLVAAGVERPEIDLKRIRERHSTLIRYSFDRLDRLNGYASGMPSPAWYQAVWEHSGARRPVRGEADGAILQDTALQMLIDVAERLRKEDASERVPTTNLIAAYEHALRLATLRSHPGPMRQDVLDAIRSCFVKGAADAEGAPALSLARRTFAGSLMGSVPAGAGVPPLVHDFQKRARRQRLKIDESLPRRLNLDIYSRVEHRVTSRLLHGMDLLGAPFAMRTAGPDFVKGTGLERLHEHWQYEYSPATEAALVEASVYGATLPEAVASKFVENLRLLEREGLGRNAAATVSWLVKACVLGLQSQIEALLDRLESSLAEDPEFTSLCTAAIQLLLLWESRDPLEAKGIDQVRGLLAVAYQRACYLMQELAACPQTLQAAAVKAIRSLHELLHGAREEKFDATLFWNGLRMLLRREPVAPLLVGTAHGLLVGAGMIDVSDIISRARGELEGREQPCEAVAYFQGLFQTARELCWQMPELLHLLDRHLAAWSEEQFLRSLPELRLAFAEMTPRETDRIAALAAELHGAPSLGPLVAYDIPSEEITGNLILSGLVREALAAEGLDPWLETTR